MMRCIYLKKVTTITITDILQISIIQNPKLYKNLKKIKKIGGNNNNNQKLLQTKVSDETPLLPTWV